MKFRFGRALKITAHSAAYGRLPLLILISGFLAASLSAPAAVEPALLPIVDQAGLPRVLLIGDSISIGYTLPVRKLLEGKANVHRIPENGMSTGVGLESLSKWLGEGKWDVIHFNWGLHDLKYMKNGKLDVQGTQVASIQEYEKNLRELVRRLKATGARLIWASTTPVPKGSSGRVAGDEITYNAAAGRVMIEEGVAIDDLHAAAVEKLSEVQLPNNVHFSPKGDQYLGEKVAAAILEQLPPAGNSPGKP